MGIEGLLQGLKPIRIKKNIKNFSGQTAAIDASTWLYKGTYSCAYDLANGVKTNAYLRYPLKMIRLLRNNNITPILVFDGQTLPLKSHTIETRKADKIKNKLEGDKLRDLGKVDEANALYARSISIKKSMLFLMIDLLNAIHVQYIVAPYEADAEIAYLCKEKLADIAITEDSDLLAYGVKNVIFKLDPEGNCEHLALDDAKNGKLDVQINDEFVNEILNLSEDKFIELCIVSGCDYLQNIPGFGIKRALKMMKFLSLDETLARIRYKKQYMGKIPIDYRERIRKIKLQFLCGRAIHPQSFINVTLREFPTDIKIEDLSGLGDEIPLDIIKKYATGMYNLKKKLERIPLAKEEALKLIHEITSHPSKDGKSSSSVKKEDTSVQNKKDENSKTEPQIIEEPLSKEESEWLSEIIAEDEKTEKMMKNTKLCEEEKTKIEKPIQIQEEKKEEKTENGAQKRLFSELYEKDEDGPFYQPDKKLKNEKNELI